MQTTDDPILTAVLAVIRANVTEVLPDLSPDLVQPHRSLTELGCNSIDRADVVAMTLEKLQVNIPITDLSEVRDIGALAELLRSHLR